LRAISESDGLTQEYKALYKVDEIAVVGNLKTVNSYKYFYPSIRVRQTQYYSHLSGEKRNLIKVPDNQFNVLVLMSAIGFRKGADIIFDIVKKSQNLQTNLVFHLVGAPSTDYWREKIEESTISNNLKYYGWIDNKSDAFSQIILGCDIALFPSREEGMVGTALECIDLGIPVVHSQMVGIDSSSEELEIQDLDSDSILQKIRNLQKIPNQTLCELADLQALRLSKQFEIGEGISYIVNDWLERNPKHHRRAFYDLITLAKIAKLWISIIYTNPKIILVRVYYGTHSQKLAALRRRIKKLRTKP
jgi:glycosyltransferase involved in cell wall biosynthesis